MPAEEARVLTYGALISIAAHRGYKKGWAAMKYKLMYGVWPNFEASANNPSGELTWWIRKQGKEYAKAKRESEVMPHAGPRAVSCEAGVLAQSALMSEDDWSVDL